MMANVFNSNSSQLPASTQNELNKTSQESTKLTSKLNETNKQNPVTSSQPNVVLPSTSEQNSTNSTLSTSIPLTKTPVVPQTVIEAIIKQGFPALAKTTKPIPASVFSYRFASPTNSQTPYYISSDIVLSGGIAQQTRRRIVHNEVERRRKDKINSWITNLAEVIPGCSHGKQSKNIVLERAVEYFTEVNKKVALLDECQQHRNKLALDNQALKQRLEILQNQNDELLELLQRNNITVPKTLTCTTSLITCTQSSLSASKSSSQSVVSDNTYVTWSTSGRTPISTSSMSNVGYAETNQSQPIKALTSTSLSVAGSNVSATSSVQQPQTNYSLYTVSSIMNELPRGVVSLVESNITQETTPVPVPIALTIGDTPVQGNDSVVPATIAVAMSTTLGSQTLDSLCAPEGGAVMGTQNAKTVGLTQDTRGEASNGIGTVYLTSGSGLLAQGREASATQGVAQVVLCQGPKVTGTQESTSINVPKGTLVASVVNQHSNPVNLITPSHHTVQAVPNTNILIQNQEPIITVGTPTSSGPNTVISTSSTPLFSSSNLQSASSFQPEGVVALNSYVTAIPSVPTTTNSPVNQGLVAMTISQGASIARDNVCVLPANVPQQRLLTINNNVTPRVNSISFAPQVLTEPNAKPSQWLSGNLGSGLVTLSVPPKPVGVVTGTPNTILHQQPQSHVTMNNPQTAIQSSCTEPLATSYGNALFSGTTSGVNLTPSSRTAFVIVRSNQPQQTVNYTVPTQTASLINYTTGDIRHVTPNCAALVSTRITPSTVVQPAVFQNVSNTGVIHVHTQFPFNSTSTPASGMNTATAVQSVNTGKRNYSKSMTKNNSTLASSQPPAKVLKGNNTKKRPPSRSSANSKSKTPKQSKTNQRGASNSNSSVKNIASTSQVMRAAENETSEQQRNSNNSMDMCQHEDMLSIQNFSISSLIPSIDSQASPAVTTKPSTPLNTRIVGNVTRTSGGSTLQAKTTSQPSSSNQRLSHSIDSLTGRSNGVMGQNQAAVQQQQQQQHHHQQQQQHQQQTQSTILSFSAESLLGSGEDLVPNIQPITCANVSNNTLSISAFQDNTSDGSINQSFSNFSAEALISESDLIGISNESHSSRTNCTQEAQSGKQTHNRTQMFSDFSAESLINSSDLGSGLSYAIDNLISRSDNNDNSIGMTSVNPNLLHTATSSMLPDNINHSMYTHSTAMPVAPMLKNSIYTPSTAMPSTPILKNHSLTSNVDFLNTSNTSATDQTSFSTINPTSYSKYGFSSPQKQSQKDIFSYKPNSSVTFTYPTSSVTTSPTFLKHSVVSITASQHNSVSSATGAFPFSSPLTNNVPCPTFNSLYFDQINPQQFQVGGSSYSNHRNFQGPTMGSYA